MKKEDIISGKFTYDQRIEIGSILSSESNEVEKFKDILKCLKVKPLSPQKLIAQFEEIIEGLRSWFEREAEMLKYEPSPEEIAAGVAEYSKKVGEFGTVKSLAKAYNQDPDTILKWEYAKVFGILYTDLEEFKYNQRYNKELEKKYAKKS